MKIKNIKTYIMIYNVCCVGYNVYLLESIWRNSKVTLVMPPTTPSFGSWAIYLRHSVCNIYIYHILYNINKYIYIHTYIALESRDVLPDTCNDDIAA